MTKLPPRYNAVALPFVLSGMMSVVVSGISTLRAVGLPADFLWQWLTAWSLSWPVAFAAVLFVLPLARRIVAMFVEPPVALAAQRATAERERTTSRV